MTNTDRQRLFLLHSAILHRLLHTIITVVMMVMMLLLLFLLLLFLLFFLLLLLVFRGLLIIENPQGRWRKCIRKSSRLETELVMKHGNWLQYSSRYHMRTCRSLVHHLHKLVSVRAANVLHPVRSL